jgi:hypothetical protein
MKLKAYPLLWAWWLLVDEDGPKPTDFRKENL